MKKISVLLMGVIFLVIGFFGGYKYFQFNYKDKCLDLGGGQNPKDYPICVVEKKVAEKKSNIQEKKNEKVYFCDEKGNKFISEEEAKKHGLEEAQFGATFCQYTED
jgi:hypothetical protein